MLIRNEGNIAGLAILNDRALLEIKDQTEAGGIISPPTLQANLLGTEHPPATNHQN